MISGWAHPSGSLKPLADALAGHFAVTAITATDLLDGCSGGSVSRRSALRGSAATCESGTFLLGWSMGGMIALEAAETWIGRVAGVMLISSTAKFCASEDNPYGTPERTVRAMTAALKKNPDEVLAQFFRSVAAPAELDAGELRAKVEGALALGVEHLGSGLRYLQLSDCRAAAKALNIPSLVCHGDKDRIIPWQAGRQLSELLPKARFVKFDGVGHDLPLRAPQALADEIMHFVETGR